MKKANNKKMILDYLGTVENKGVIDKETVENMIKIFMNKK